MQYLQSIPQHTATQAEKVKASLVKVYSKVKSASSDKKGFVWTGEQFIKEHGKAKGASSDNERYVWTGKQRVLREDFLKDLPHDNSENTYEEPVPSSKGLHLATE